MRHLLPLLLLSSTALAAPPALDRSQRPPEGPPPKIDMPRPTRFALAGGTQVLVVERHTLPMTSLLLLWPSGATQDPARQFGIAGVTADLLNEGTSSRPAMKLAEEIESLGAHLESFATWDATGIAVTTLVRHLEPALGLLADVAAHPALDAAELERVRQQRLTALLQQRDSAGHVAANALLDGIYGAGTREGWPLVGRDEDLRRLTRDDVVAFHRRHLRPDRATLVVVGDVRPDRLRPLLEKAFAGWKAEGAVEPLPARPAAPASRPRLIIADRPGVPQTEIRLGHRGPARLTPDYFPLVVMNNILGGYFNSRLNSNLREKHGYTYGARSDFSFRREGGPFHIATPVKTEVTAAALRETLGELRGLRAAPVTDEELRRSKDLLRRAMGRRLETVGDVAGELGTSAIQGLPDDYLPTYAERVEAVTAADVQRVAVQHLDPEHLIIVLAGDRKAISPTLAPLKLPEIEGRDAKGNPLPPAPPPPTPAPRPASPPSTPIKAR